MIYLIPHSGLANRIRVIASGLALSDRFNQPLVLVWRVDNSLHCEFRDLFEPSNRFTVRNYSLFYRLLHKLQQQSLIRRLLFQKILRYFLLFDENFPEYVWSTGNNTINHEKIPVNTRHFIISTCHDFLLTEDYLKLLHPVNAVSEQIKLNTSRFSQHTIGVHIRRTDHFISKQKSPLHLFVDAIKLEMENNPVSTVYLSTDDPEVEEKLIQEFPGKIFRHPKDFSRNTKKGIQDALVDLYSLAQTSRIYGSFGSSFSEMAASIGKIPLTVVEYPHLAAARK